MGSNDGITEFAHKENLSIIGEYIEKQSAKIPGRPVFNDMMGKLNTSELPVSCPGIRIDLRAIVSTAGNSSI